MTLNQVIANLERTISIKEMHYQSTKNNPVATDKVEYIVEKTTNVYLGINIDELKRILADLKAIGEENV